VAHWQLVPTSAYLGTRNDAMWSEAFHTDIRAAELSLATLFWEQLNALPQPAHRRRQICARLAWQALMAGQQDKPSVSAWSPHWSSQPGWDSCNSAVWIPQAPHTSTPGQHGCMHACMHAPTTPAWKRQQLSDCAALRAVSGLAGLAGAMALTCRRPSLGSILQ